MNGKLGSVRSRRRLAALGGIAGALVLALLVLHPFGEPVALRTTDTPGYTSEHSCFAAGDGGRLVVDPVAGTGIIETEMARGYVQVIWPGGYTARRAGSEVEVLNRHGDVVARTGTDVHFVGGYAKGGFLVCGLEGIQP